MDEEGHVATRDPASRAASADDSRSLRGRALLAVALTVSFYVLAIGIALALIAVPIALFASAGRGNIWVAIAMIGAGLAILRAIVPERDRYQPPGPELTRDRQPRLHALLDEIADRTGAHRADAVYLDLPVNAAVLEHRGRRVMHVGLPLLATLDADELRAVVAHEYGHYVGGDTRFSGWIWRTRAAAIKTVERLAESESWFRRSIVRWPFQWYGLLFLRITNAVSRRAEFAADALAARVASPEAAGRSLRRVAALAPVFDHYWFSDVAPVLAAEKRPAIASGFVSVVANEDLAATLDDVVRSDVEEHEPNPYASHPTLRQRLEALGLEAEARAPAPVPEPASRLLDDVPELERRLLEEQFGVEAGAYRPIDWSAATDVHLDRLRESVERFGAAFPPGLTFADAGATAANLTAYDPKIRELLSPEDRDVPPEPLRGLLLDVLCGMVVTGGADAGAEVTAAPGEPIRLHHRGETLDPWKVLGEVASRDAESRAWAEHPVVRALGDTAIGHPPVTERAVAP